MLKLVTEEVVVNAAKNKESIISVSKNCIITPAAKDALVKYKITISTSEPKKSFSSVTLSTTQSFSDPSKINIAVGSDHTGYDTKLIMIKFLQDKGYNVTDVGTNSKEACDYPDFAKSLALKVIKHEADFSIMFDATGSPGAITANKFKGIRAAVCYNEFSAKSAREHNNANILCIGAKAFGEETIKSIIDVWLKTEYAGGRHQKRLDKITEVENMLAK